MYLRFWVPENVNDKIIETTRTMREIVVARVPPS